MNDAVCSRVPFLIKSKSDRQGLRRADLVLMAAFLMAAFLLGVCFLAGRRAGSVVRITCDGMECGRIELQDIDQYSQKRYYLILLPEEAPENGDAVKIVSYAGEPGLPQTGHYNLLTVEGRNVTMAAADCRDQICVHHRAIRLEGESIICLPHKIVVEIERTEEEGEERLDGVTR